MLGAAHVHPLDAETPEEIILRAHLDRTDRAELVQRLCDYDYTFPIESPIPGDGEIPGTWNQIGPR